MTSTERQIIHHLTTALGAVQVTESERGVYLDLDNTATDVNVSLQRWRGLHEVTETAIYCFETPNMQVSWTRFGDEMPEPYRDLVTIRFEQIIEGLQTRSSTFHFYMDPKAFKSAVTKMTEEPVYTETTKLVEATDEND